MFGYSRVLSLPVFLLCVGCAAIDKASYPSEWPAIVSGRDSCGSINGRYESRAASYTYPHPHRDHFLSLAMLPVDSYRLIEAVSLEYGDDNSLKVIGYSGNGAPLKKYTYTAGSGFFACSDGILVLDPARKPDREHASDNPLVGTNSEEIALTKAQDGSLVMRSSASAVGMAFLLIPVYADTEHWYRFEQLNAIESPEE